MAKKFVVETQKTDFQKSSFSKNNPKTCVMVARKKEGVALADSKDPSLKTKLHFNNEEWDAFVKGVKNGEFDVQ